jgi:hypothetical protein
MLIAATWAVLIGASAGSVDAQSGAPAGTQFMLTGVVVVEGGGGRAWLQEPTLTHNEIVTVRPGDSIGPYRLTKVLQDRVELEGPAGKFFVRLSGAPGPATAAAGPPPPAPLQEPAPVTEREQTPPVDLGTARVTRFDFRDFGSLLNSMAGDRR